MRRSRNLVLGAALLAATLALAACRPGGDGAQDGKATIVVGVSGAFAENQIVAEMYAQVLENAGYEVTRQLDLGSREISQPALERGEIHIKPEYLSTLLLFLDENAQASGNPDEVAAALEPLLEERGVKLLPFSEADDTNALVVTGQTAQTRNLSKVSDLAPIAGQLTFGGPPECPNRPFCIPGLKGVYGIEFGDFKPLDVGGPLTVAALEGGEIHVALLFSTSGVIGRKGFVVLEDDKELQQADNIVPVVLQSVLNSEIEDLLNSVSASLTTEKITELNAKVEVDQTDPSEVARGFLEEEGLL